MPVFEDTTYRQYRADQLYDATDQYVGTTPVQIEALDFLYNKQSDAVRRNQRCKLDIPYGSEPDQRLDAYLTDAQNAPIMIFVHGGGYREGEKEGRGFPASVFADAGAIWIAVEYTRLPNNTISGIVYELCQAVRWVYSHASELGGDPDRLFMSGNSAGGNLTGLVVATDWSKWDLPANVLKGAAVVASNLDLESKSTYYEREELYPDAERQNGVDAYRGISAKFHLPNAGTRMFIAVGELESTERHRMAIDYYEELRRHGFGPRLWIAENHNHFSIIGEYANPESPLVETIFEFMNINA